MEVTEETVVRVLEYGGTSILVLSLQLYITWYRYRWVCGAGYVRGWLVTVRKAGRFTSARWKDDDG